METKLYSTYEIDRSKIQVPLLIEFAKLHSQKVVVGANQVPQEVSLYGGTTKKYYPPFTKMTVTVNDTEVKDLLLLQFGEGLYLVEERITEMGYEYVF